MLPKVVVLGCNGMAGHVITLGLMNSGNYDVISIARSRSSIDPKILLDVFDFKSLRSKLNYINPDIIVNCVGVLNSNASNNPEAAILANAYLPRFLESITRKSRTKIIHISTDCVFFWY